jgi:hypothetical protein
MHAHIAYSTRLRDCHPSATIYELGQEGKVDGDFKRLGATILSKVAEQRQEIEQLINENEGLERRFAAWQQTDDPSAAEVHAGQREYLDWYARAERLVPSEELDRFRDMYEGGQFIQRVRGFISAPRTFNVFYDPAEPNPLVDKWQNPFRSTCQPALLTQRQILIAALHEAADANVVLSELSAYFRRLPDYLLVLDAASNANVPSPKMGNEGDLQLLVHALLKLLYRDVRPEDSVSKRAGAASRVDFLIKDAGVIVETKMTRPSLTDKRVGEELLVDWGRYERHPDCRGIFGLVYDPGCYLGNPAGLEDDLSNSKADIPKHVIVVR